MISLTAPTIQIIQPTIPIIDLSSYLKGEDGALEKLGKDVSSYNQLYFYYGQLDTKKISYNYELYVNIL